MTVHWNILYRIFISNFIVNNGILKSYIQNFMVFSSF